MQSLSAFFEVNRQVVLFVYGLVFFSLGFAILLQSRKSSRLALAAPLRWLAAFGFIHGFHEWGDLFIPIQQGYLSDAAVAALQNLQILTLAVSFACLMEFGLALLSPEGRKRRIHWRTVAIFAAWLTVVLAGVPAFAADARERGAIANALARYFILFPGGMLAAYGLRRYARERIAPLNMPAILRMFEQAAFWMALYSLFSGLIPPPVPFFPGSVFNAETFARFVSVPPMVFRSLTGLAIAVTLTRGLEIFQLEAERRIESLEQQQIIQAERERLARELHDGAIQKVYTAGLLVEAAGRLAERGTELDRRLKRAVAAIGDSILDLRRNLAELYAHSQTSYDSLERLLGDLLQNRDYGAVLDVSLKTDLPAGRRISARCANHIAAIVNEALSNAARHSSATRVWVSASGGEDKLKIEIKDDGGGLPPQVQYGYGLRNMSDRARLLNGALELINKDNGLTISLEIPWNE